MEERMGRRGVDRQVASFVRVGVRKAESLSDDLQGSEERKVSTK